MGEGEAMREPQDLSYNSLSSDGAEPAMTRV